MVVNELYAFSQLGPMKAPRSSLVHDRTFALCGFANFSSIGIQIAHRRARAGTARQLAKIRIRAMLAAPGQF